MIPCACSLRSTQCAALIALATVAGIVRFEQGRPTAAAEDIDATQRVEKRAAPGDCCHHHSSLETMAPWLRLFEGLLANVPRFTPDEHTVDGSAEETSAPSSARQEKNLPGIPLPVSGSKPLSFARDDGPPFSTRAHSFPFALGPPRRGTRSMNHRADGTEVPGDSTVWRKVFSRIAFPASFSSAPAGRAESAKQDFVASCGNRGVALSGEPEYLAHDEHPAVSVHIA